MCVFERFSQSFESVCISNSNSTTANTYKYRST